MSPGIYYECVNVYACTALGWLMKVAGAGCSAECADCADHRRIMTEDSDTADNYNRILQLNYTH